jgi:hypothetical protein
MLLFLQATATTGMHCLEVLWRTLCENNESHARAINCSQ